MQIIYFKNIISMFINIIDESIKFIIEWKWGNEKSLELLYLIVLIEQLTDSQKRV